MPSPAGGGRYLGVGLGPEAIVLATFKDGADLACHTPARARALDEAISRNRTLHGAIKPAWRTTVVCGFVESTSAVCWQFSTGAREFVQIGEWTT